MDAEKTGKLIAEKRRAKGLKQRDLAAMIHVSDTTVSKYENGKRIPDISTLEKIAEALDVSLEELARGETADTYAGPSPVQTERPKYRLLALFFAVPLFLMIFSPVWKTTEFRKLRDNGTAALYSLNGTGIDITSYIVKDGKTVTVPMEGFAYVPENEIRFLSVSADRSYGLRYIGSGDFDTVDIPDEGTADDPGDSTYFGPFPMNWADEVKVTAEEQILGIDAGHDLSVPLQEYLKNMDFGVIITAKKH